MFTPLHEFVALMLVLVGVFAWRVHQVVPWRTLASVARSTGSPKACLEFIRFCERH